MAALERAELELTATIDGSSRTGTFVILGGESGQASIVDRGRTGYLLQGAGSNVVSILQQALANDAPKRQGIFFDLGAGDHAFDLDFQLVDGMTDENGTTPQWGSSSSTGTENAHTATGADPRRQGAVFMNYWRIGQYDSRNAATFRWWDYSSGGVLGELEVAIESPSFSAVAGSPAVDGTMTLVEITSTSDPLDANQRPSR